MTSRCSKAARRPPLPPILARSATYRAYEGRGFRRTVVQQALECLLHLQLGVEHDDPEADRERVVGYPSLEEAADSCERGVVRLLALERWQVRGRAGAAR